MKVCDLVFIMILFCNNVFWIIWFVKFLFVCVIVNIIYWYEDIYNMFKIKKMIK